MEIPNFVPVLDYKALQDKVNKYAQEGAEKAIKEYYTAFNSPYYKGIEKALTQEGELGIELPSIVALLNKAITEQYDAIINEAIAHSYLPLITRFLVKVEKEMKFSDFLKKIIEETECTNSSEYSITIEKGDYDASHCDLIIEDKKYRFSIYPERDIVGGKLVVNENKCHIFTMPYDRENYKEEMTLEKDGVSLKMPFTKNILADPIMMLFANLVICKTNLIMDCKEFELDFFTDFERFEDEGD